MTKNVLQREKWEKKHESTCYTIKCFYCLVFIFLIISTSNKTTLSAKRGSLSGGGQFNSRLIYLKSGLIRELMLWGGATVSELRLSVSILIKMEKISFKPKQKQTNSWPRPIFWKIQCGKLFSQYELYHIEYQINIISFIVNMTLRVSTFIILYKDVNVWHLVIG